MNLTYLREFTTFSEYMNVSEAARHLYLSKSALSKHLALLEQEIGAQLFTREKPMSLTPAGCLMIVYCEEVLAAYSRIQVAIAASAK